MESLKQPKNGTKGSEEKKEKKKVKEEDDDVDEEDEESPPASNREVDMKDTIVPDSEIVEDEFICGMICKLMEAKMVQDQNVKLPGADQPNANHKTPAKGPVMAQADLQLHELVKLCEMSRKSLLGQASLLRIPKEKLPLTICGDIHGNFPHLRDVFRFNGGPHKRTYLFLGDYVDRGVQGCETFALLMALQYRYPTKVHLLRGNHEDANTTLAYGFYDECRQNFPHGGDADTAWKAFLSVFNCLPVAAIVDKSIMCMHGGLSPFMGSLQDLEKVQRPCIVPPYGILCDLVWADPVDKFPGWALSHRGISFTFGVPVVEEFCSKYEIDIIIRGHQIDHDMYRNGYRFLGNGRLVTIFSSLNYINYKNNACVCNVSRGKDIHFVVFRCRKYANRRRGRKKSSRSVRASRSKQNVVKTEDSSDPPSC